MPTSSRCRTKSNEEISASAYKQQMAAGMPTNKLDYLNRKLVGWTVAVAALLVITYMTWDYWYIRKPQSYFRKLKDGTYLIYFSKCYVNCYCNLFHCHFLWSNMLSPNSMAHTKRWWRDNLDISCTDNTQKILRTSKTEHCGNSLQVNINICKTWKLFLAGTSVEFETDLVLVTSEQNLLNQTCTELVDSFNGTNVCEQLF